LQGFWVNFIGEIYFISLGSLHSSFSYGVIGKYGSLPKDLPTNFFSEWQDKDGILFGIGI
jgi:hypothetical protein